MAPQTPRLPDVFSADELARAAGVPVRQVRALIRSHARDTSTHATAAAGQEAAAGVAGAGRRGRSRPP